MYLPNFDVNVVVLYVFIHIQYIRQSAAFRGCNASMYSISLKHKNKIDLRPAR